MDKRLFYKKPKYKCHLENNITLSAAGILFFEETPQGKGIWAIEEIGYPISYSDFGGKYDYNDGDILATIIREFREETYNTAELSYKDVCTIDKSYYVYINGYDLNPAYMCIIIPKNKFNINFDTEKVIQAKQKIMKANPNIPNDWYKTNNIRFILLKDIESGKISLCGRLEAILKSVVNNLSLYNEEIQFFFKDFNI